MFDYIDYVLTFIIKLTEFMITQKTNIWVCLPENFHRGGKTYPKCERYHITSWNLGLHENGKVGRALEIPFLCFLTAM